MTPATRALVVIDPNNPTGAVYSTATRRALLDFADRHGLAILADEVYGDLAYDGPVAPLGSLDPDAPIISFSSLSKAYLAPGWRTGWMAVGRSPRLDAVAAAINKLADGRLCSTVPMQYAVAAALTGDRSHQASFRAALKARAALTTHALNAMPGVSCVAPAGAFYAMPKIALPPGRTDEDYVLALLRETGVLCVYGSGFGLPAADGFLRIVFLASLDELRDIYRLMADFTSEISRTRVISDREFTGRMIRTVLTVTVAVLVVAALYAAREALMLIYVSALIAMGFSPLVRLIERPRVRGAPAPHAPGVRDSG